VLALLGAALIAFSVFLPFIVQDSRGETQSVTFWDFDDEDTVAAQGPGLPLLILAAVAALVILLGLAEHVWGPWLLLVWFSLNQFPSLWVYTRNGSGLMPGFGWGLLFAGMVLLSAPLWIRLRGVGTSAPVEADSPRLERLLSGIGLALLAGGLLVPIYRADSELVFLPRVDAGSSHTFVIGAILLALGALVLRQGRGLWVFGLLLILMLANDLRLALAAVDAATSGALRLGWLLLFDGAVALALTFFLGGDRDRAAGTVRRFFAVELPADEEAEDAEEDEGERG
jgi:hypothetical protein